MTRATVGSALLCCVFSIEPELLVHAQAQGASTWPPPASGIGASTQSGSPSTEKSSVLATVPTPPPGTVPQPGSMSGLPLQVGDLPPGTVAVRVIRGDFSRNLAGQPVQLHVKSSGRVLTSQTGQDGRAVFTDLAVGDEVQATALIDGERLESQPFELPSQGGVRLVLVAAAGETALSTGETQVAPVAPSTSGSMATMEKVGFVAGMWIVVLGLFAVLHRRKIRARKSAPAEANSHEPAHRQGDDRDRLVQALLSAEREHEAGRLSAEQYQSQRVELVGNLERLYLRSEAG